MHNILILLLVAYVNRFATSKSDKYSFEINVTEVAKWNNRLALDNFRMLNYANVVATENCRFMK